MKSEIKLSVPLKNDGISYEGQIEELYSAIENMRQELIFILNRFEQRIENLESK